jgi:hypothetical protein
VKTTQEQTPDMLPTIARVAAVCFLGGLSAALCAQPDPSANAGFDTYTHTVEARLEQQHRAAEGFLAPASIPQTDSHHRKSEFLVENLTPTPDLGLPGALLFHWRCSTFIKGASAADFERLQRDYNAYPKVFSPEVLQASILSRDGDHLQTRMRVRQHHVITVVLDTTYDVTVGHLNPQHGYSLSRSTDISEIDGAGTPSEHALAPTQAHGFMWRLNTYWTWEERDDGLYLQIESVSLTRSIPSGVGWIVRPFVESIPRESLEFTLRSAAKTLLKEPEPLDQPDQPVPKS